MMKYLLLAILIALPVLAACGDDDDDDDSASVTQTTAAATDTSGPTATATSGSTGTATATVAPTSAADSCPDNPDPATADQVQVTAPNPGDQISSPAVISGLIAVFEAQFDVRIVEANGNEIVPQTAAASNEGQTLAPFSVTVPFTVSAQTPACIEVYDVSNADGVSHVDVYQIPVTLLP